MTIVEKKLKKIFFFSSFKGLFSQLETLTILQKTSQTRLCFHVEI